MTVTTIYPQAWMRLATGTLGNLADPATDLRLMLAGPAYTPSDAHDTVAAVTAAEVFGGGYTAGGLALTGRTLMWDAALKKAVLGCADLVFASASWVAGCGIVYVNTGDPATSPLMAHLDFDPVVTTDGTDYPMSWPDGLLRFGPPA